MPLPTLFSRSFLAVASASAVLTLGATPLAAQGNGRQTATLETPSTHAKVMGKDVVWNCAGNACNAPRGNARPAISCSALVKQAGKVTAFSVGGVALDEAALTRCNSFAR